MSDGTILVNGLRWWPRHGWIWNPLGHLWTSRLCPVKPLSEWDCYSTSLTILQQGSWQREQSLFRAKSALFTQNQKSHSRKSAVLKSHKISVPWSQQYKNKSWREEREERSLEFTKRDCQPGLIYKVMAACVSNFNTLDEATNHVLQDFNARHLKWDLCFLGNKEDFIPMMSDCFCLYPFCNAARHLQ